MIWLSDEHYRLFRFAGDKTYTKRPWETSWVRLKHPHTVAGSNEIHLIVFGKNRAVYLRPQTGLIPERHPSERDWDAEETMDGIVSGKYVVTTPRYLN